MQGIKGNAQIGAAEIEEGLASGLSLSEIGRQKNVKSISSYAIRYGINVRERQQEALRVEVRRVLEKHGQISKCDDSKYSQDALYRGARAMGVERNRLEKD